MMQHIVGKRALTLAALMMANTAMTACASLNNKEKGAIIGAATGAAAGGAIGNKNGGTARGAIIGAAVGGAAGAIIGHQMDQRAKELQQNIKGARVERVGEGILVTFESGLLFDFDSDVLRTPARDNLKELASSYSKYPDTDIMVVGHTDAQGDDAYNQRLSERRAASAAAFLTQQGVPTVHVRTAGKGETEPVSGNDTDAGRQANRRVEVALYASDKAQAAAKAQAKSGL